MGIIIRQSFKGSIYSYIGLVLGYINVGIIMPKFFGPEQIGLVQIFASLSLIFAQFSALGFTSVIFRIFPKFRSKEKGHHGFLFLTLATGALGFLISTGAFLILKPFTIEANIDKSPLLIEYLYLLIPLVFFRLLFNLLDAYNRVLFDAVTGILWQDFGHKAINLLLIISFALGWINFQQFFFGYIISLSFPVIPIIIKLIKRGDFNLDPNLNFIDKSLGRGIIAVASFGFINSVSGVLALNLDKILVIKYLSLEQVGIFSVCALFATVIKIPSQSISKTSIGIISEAWEKKNEAMIQNIYYKASLNQMVIGTLLFIGLLINLDAIFMILPEVYSSGRWVLIIYSFTILIDSSNTISQTIIGTSKYFWMTSIIMIAIIIVTVGANIVLIPKYGITGAAMATGFSLIFGSIVRVIFIQIKFGMFCYGYNHLAIIGIASFTVFGIYMMPNAENWITNLLLKSAITTIVYSILIWTFKISPDLNELIKAFVKKT